MAQHLPQKYEKIKPLSSMGIYIKTAAMMAIFIVGVAALAGRWDWWTGWTILGVFILYSLILFRWLSSNDPELARERRQDSDERNHPYERVIIPIMVVLELALLIVATLDNGRFAWSTVPVWTRVIGWVLLAFTLVMVPWVFRTNTFASGVGRIQSDRDHHVVTSGPYRFVRHPMYAGVIVCFIGLPLVLGSWWALIPGGLLAALFVLRTAFEDRMLHNQLSGYSMYSQRIRFRLFPGIW